MIVIYKPELSVIERGITGLNAKVSFRNRSDDDYCNSVVASRRDNRGSQKSFIAVFWSDASRGVFFLVCSCFVLN